MATHEVKLPEISESAEAGTVTSVLVSTGDSISEGDSIIEIETDKASVEVPADAGGTVEEVKVSEGDELSEGDVILVLETSGEGGGDEVEEAAPSGEEAPSGDQADAADRDEADDVAQGDAQGNAATPKGRPGEQSPPTTARGNRESPVPVPASPSTRRLAREIGVDIRATSGTGPAGRISAEDVKRHARERSAQPAGGTSGVRGALATQLPDFSRFGSVHRETMSQVRRITAENTQGAWQVVPHVTQHDEAAVDAVEQFRQTYKETVAKAGGKLTVTAILLKVVAAALRKFPRVNSSVDMAAGEIIYKDYVNVGVAVDTDRGLLVPVVRDVDKKTLTELSVELSQMAEKARDKKLSPKDMEGGNFTISNLGGIGGTAFTPVVFAPQVAILGVARAKTVPFYKDGGFVPQLMLPLSLSYDHRVVDGADGARFLRWTCEALEHPMSMSL